MQDTISLLDELTIESQLPITFENQVTVNVFSGKCGYCGEIFSSDQIRGTIDSYFKSTLIVKAAARCDQCHTVTDLSIRVKDDKSTSKKVGGRWVNQHPIPASRLIHWHSGTGSYIGIAIGFAIAYGWLFFLTRK